MAVPEVNDREKLRAVLRELRQAAFTPYESSAKLTLLLGGSKEFLAIYRWREVRKDTLISLS